MPLSGMDAVILRTVRPSPRAWNRGSGSKRTLCLAEAHLPILLPDRLCLSVGHADAVALVAECADGRQLQFYHNSYLADHFGELKYMQSARAPGEHVSHPESKDHIYIMCGSDCQHPHAEAAR